MQEVPDENYDLPYNQNETNGDAVMIKMDVPSSREEPSFPKEKWKTFIGKCGYTPEYLKMNRKQINPKLIPMFNVQCLRCVNNNYLVNDKFDYK